MGPGSFAAAEEDYGEFKDGMNYRKTNSSRSERKGERRAQEFLDFTTPWYGIQYMVM